MRTWLTAPFFLSACFAFHALLMNGYKFGWWENLVIHAYYLPATYARVDPSLYPRDLFVNTMKQGVINSSYFWEGLAYLFKFFPPEPVVFFIYVVGLYSIFLALFYLAQTLFKNKLVSCGTLLLYSFGLRHFNLGSEALYFNFLHTGIVGYPLALLSIILFLKKRYAWAFALCGILFNLHSMYTTFLLFIFCTFFLIPVKQMNRTTVLLCCLSFSIPALPSLVFIVPQLASSWGGEAWLTGIRWTHWVHDFPSCWGVEQYARFFCFALLFVLALFSVRLNDAQKDALLLFPGIALMCALGTVFSELVPVPLIIKLQLWRSLWIFMAVAMVFISNFLISSWREDFFSRFSSIVSFILITGYSAYKNALPPDFGRIPVWLLPLLGLYLFCSDRYAVQHRSIRVAQAGMVILLPVITIAPFVSPLKKTFLNIGTDLLTIFYCLIAFLLTLRYFEQRWPSPAQRSRLYLGAFLVFLVTYDGGLLWRQTGPHIDINLEHRVSVHPWIDMQRYCRDHTPQNALFIVPPYMQGFRLFSKRSTFGDWLDGMLINWTGEEYAVEWLRRMKLLGWTAVKGEWAAYNNLSTEAFLKIAEEYTADYIVGEKKLHLNLPVVYQNQGFVLYATGIHEIGRQ